MFYNIQYELVVLSDIHLRTEDDERGSLLLKFLSSLAVDKVRYLVLLGDIFDFCVGYSPYFQKKYAAIGSALSHLASCGVQVYFVEGNHEFCLSELPWRGVHFLRGQNLHLKLSNGESVVLTHGDLLRAPWHYRLYNWAVRSRLLKWMALMLPQALLDRLALAISAKSRARGYTRKIDHKAIVGGIARWAQQQGVQCGIVGHFHVPYDVQVDTKTRLLCLDSWDKPNALIYDQGSFSRLYFRNNKVHLVELSPKTRN